MGTGGTDLIWFENPTSGLGLGLGSGDGREGMLLGCKEGGAMEVVGRGESRW